MITLLKHLPAIILIGIVAYRFCASFYIAIKSKDRENIIVNLLFLIVGLPVFLFLMCGIMNISLPFLPENIQDVNADGEIGLLGKSVFILLALSIWYACVRNCVKAFKAVITTKSVRSLITFIVTLATIGFLAFFSYDFIAALQ